MKTIEQSVGQLSNESPSTSASATTTAAPSSASTNQTKPTRTSSTSDVQPSPSLAKQPPSKPHSVTSSQNQQQPMATLGYSDVTTPSDDDVIRLPSVKNLSSLFSEQKQVNVSDVSASKRVSK